MDVSDKLFQDGKEVKLDIEAIVYKDLQDITRMLGMGIIKEFGGSDAEGYYLRLGEGTQICFGHVIPDRSITDEQQFNFPKKFVGLSPYVGISHEYGVNNLYRYACKDAHWGAILNRLRVAFPTTTTVGRSLPLHYFAIGRWK